MANQITYKIGYQVDKTTLDEIKSSLQSLQNLTSSDLMNLNERMNLPQAVTKLNQIKESAKELERILNKSFNSDLGILNVTKFNSELNNSNIGINRIYKDFSVAGIAGQTAFKNITTQILTTNMQLKQSHSLLDSLAVTMRNTIKWSISSAVMNQFTGSIEKAYGYVKNLDRSLNDIRIVTSKSSDDMAEFAVQANKAAQELAASTTDYTNASLIYYQQGLSDEEVAARTEVTLKAANVTQQDTAEVSEQLTSIWNGYKVNAEEAELYIDKVAAVAATTASDLEELATGMSRVASAANLMGVDVDQLNAQLSTIISVTRQAPESVGTALRSIYARMSDIESGLDEETTLGKYTEDMAAYGINVLDANNKLRDMGDVIEEIGNKWSSMTREQQVGLSQAAAGTRQYNNLLALFDNWDDYTDAIEVSRNAIGTLQQQQDIYMEGTQAHLKQLKTAQEDLYDSLLTSDDINKIVDVFTDLTKAATTFVDTIGGGKNVLVGLGVIGSQVFGKQISKGISTSIINLQGLRDNAAKISAQFEILQQFKGIDLDDSDTQKLVSMKEEVLSYGNTVTAEQQNQANELIKTTNELQNQKRAWEEAKQAAQDFYQQYQGEDFDFNDLDESQFNLIQDEIKTIKNEFGSIDSLYKEFEKNLDEAQKKIEKGIKIDSDDLKDDLFEIGKSIHPFIADIENFTEAGRGAPEVLNTLADAFEEFKASIKSIPTEEVDLGEAIMENANVRESAKKLAEAYNDAGKQIAQEAKKTANTLRAEFGGASDTIKNKMDQVEQSFKDMTNAWNIEQMVQRYVQLASTLSQVAFTYNSLVSVIDTWRDKDASLGEQITQTLTFAGTTIPMLINAFSKLNEVFGTTNFLIGIRNGYREKENALTTESLLKEGLRAVSLDISKVKEEALIAALSKKIAAENLDIKTIEYKQMLEILEQSAKEMNITLTEKQTKEILAKIEAQRAEALATKGSDIATKAWNASLLANPIVMVTAALAALTLGLMAYSRAQEKARERTIETYEATRDAGLAIEEENQKIQDLYNTYLSYYSVYKKTGEGKEDLIKSTESLVDSMGEEIRTIDLLSDSYDNAGKKISEFRQKRAKEDLDQAKKSRDAARLGFIEKTSKKFGTEDLRTIDFYTGISLKDDRKIMEALGQALSDFDIAGRMPGVDDSILQLGFQNLGFDPTSWALTGIKKEDIPAIYEAIQEFYNNITDQFDDTTLLEAEFDDSIREWLTKYKQDYDDYIDLVNDVKEYASQLAEATAQLEAEDFDISKITSLDEFEQYRNTYISTLERIFSEEDIEYTQEQLKNYADQYLGSLDVLSDYVQDFNIREELRQAFENTNTQEEINAFLDELELKGHFKIAATVELEEGDSIEVFSKNLDRKLREMFRASVVESEEAIRNVMSGVQSGDINYQNISDNEDYQTLIKNLETIKSQYPEIEVAAEELGRVWNVGTQRYAEALEMVQDKLADIKMDSLVSDARKAADDLAEFFEYDEEGVLIDINADATNFESTLDAFLNANYAIDIEVHTQAEQEFDSIMNAMEDMKTKAAMIGEDFIVAASDIRELNNTFPGIIQGLEEVGDGTVRLNKEIVESAIDSAEAEVAADMEATVNRLKFQAELLRGKEASYRSMAEAAAKLGSDEVLSENEAAEQKAIISHGVAEVEGYNDQLTTDLELDNNEIVANDSKNAGEVIAKNFKEAYMESLRASAAFAEGAIANMKAAAAGGGSIINPESAFGDVQYQGSTYQSSEAKMLEGVKDKLKEPNIDKDYWNRMEDQFNSAANSVGAMANELEGMAAQIGATGIELGQQFKDIGKKKGKEKSGKDPDLMDYLEDEADRYHDINLELEALETHLDRLDKQQKKLYGKDLIQNLNEQLDILEKQKDAYAVKLEIARQEQKELRKSLSSQGVTFDSEGYMGNYAAALQSKLDYVNAVIAKYNKMSAEEQEGFKDTVEAAKEDYEKFKSQMERYDELISSFIPDIEDAVQDAIDKQIEINIQRFRMEVEIRLDMGEAEREFNEFRRKVLDGIKDTDILGNAKSKLKDFTSYFDTEGTGIGPVQALTDHINTTMDQIKQIDKLGTSVVYGDNKAQGLADLEKDYKELMSQLEAVVDLVDEIKESYLDMIDEATEAFDKQVDQYEYISDLLNHNMNVIGLVYGDKAYAEMARYYEQIEDNNNQELDFLKKRAAYAEEMMNAETDPEAREKWEEEWMDALETLNDKIEDSLQNIINKYKNAVSLVFDELNKKVTGGLGLDYVNDEWDLINKNSEQYLDTINALYGIQELENKYLEAIDQTDNLSSQKKLNDMMNEQLGMLRDKDKLTQYDVDRANMMYEIALKQIALEEAQQNKSQLRLKRDAQGNYSYQFVANDEDVDNAKDDLLAAQNDLYNFDKQHYKENLDDIYNYYVEFQQKYNNIMTDMSLTDEERQERTKLLAEQYGQLINGLVEQNETIRTNLHESTFMALEGMYEFDAKSFEEMTGKNIEAFRNLTIAEQAIIIGELIPQWDSGVQHMANVFAGEGGLIPVCSDAFKQLDETTKSYITSIGNLEEAAGISFTEIGKGYDSNIKKAKNLLDKNDELIKKYGEEISNIKMVIVQLNELIDKYKVAQIAAENATKAAYAFITAEKAKAAEDAAKDKLHLLNGRPTTITDTDDKNKKPSNGDQKGNTGGEKGNKGDGVPNVGDAVTITGGLFYYDSYGTTPSGNNKGQWTGKTVYITRMNSGGTKPIHVSAGRSLGSGDLGWLTKNQISGYDTGGYTGDWGNSNGKLAVLHQKEIVLNSSDTENMLAAVSIVRDMAGMLENLNTNIVNRLAGLSAGFNIPISGISAPSNTVEQDVHIEASFPNAQNANEIKNALDNLINIASQHANRVRK